MHKELSWSEKITYSLIIILGSLLLYEITPTIIWNMDTYLFILIFAGLSFPLYLRKYALWILRISFFKRRKGTATRWIMDDIPTFVAIFLKGAGVAAWVIGLASFLFQVYLLTDALSNRLKGLIPERFLNLLPDSLFSSFKKQAIRIIRRKEHIRGSRLFPLGQVLYGFTSPFYKILVIIPSGIIYERINQGDALISSGRNVAAVIAMFIVYFSIAALLNSLTVMLRSRKSFSHLFIILRDYYADLTIHIFMLCPLGILFAIIYLKAPYALILLAVPLIAMHKAMKNFEDILTELEKFIYTLANAIDARDHYTYGHSDRVAKYSRALAEEMGLSPQEVDDIERAGRIHDLGKIDIPDSILRKQGRLDENEYDIMKKHTQKVKELFEDKTKLSEKIPLELAYSHHERYDGKGYIFGKKGDEIPLGARILSVADTFDALTTDRPYRKGMDPQEALECIISESGTQLDPQIVEVFRHLFTKGIIQKLMEKDEESEKE